MAQPKGDAGAGKVKRFLAKLVPTRATDRPPVPADPAPKVQVTAPEPLKNPGPAPVKMRSTLVRGLAKPAVPRPKPAMPPDPAPPAPTRTRYSTSGPRTRRKRDYPIL